MKKVSFIMAGLVSLLLVGCGGSEGSVSATDTDFTDSSIEDSSGYGIPDSTQHNVVNANATGLAISEELTPPPAFPEQ